MSLKSLAEALQRGEVVTFRPKGNSMTPKIKSGQQVTVRPVYPDMVVQRGDIVLAKVHGRYYLHLVDDIKEGDHYKHYRICNNRGYVNGWSHDIYGVVCWIGD